ncbi:MAG TPA: hypothetical protein PLE11_03445, partial [Bacteroidales bacterium]|nr:hypothetical protein [Bacteroidales bacterium]
IDDEDCMRLLRLFNEPEGKKHLAASGLSSEIISQLSLIGISGIGNLLSAIKAAKHFEMTSEDVIVTLATDSAEMYQSRVTELAEQRGVYNSLQAAKDFEKCLFGTGTDNIKELTYNDRKAIHNLKYYTWVEQQGKTYEEINQLWYDRNFWPDTFNQVTYWDEKIDEFNERSGVLKNL